MILNSPTISGSLTVTNNVNITGAITASGGISIPGSIASASYAGTASIAVIAATASSADDFLTRGTLTAQTLVVQTITSSVDFVTGSTRFGSLLANTHTFTGSMNLTGSLTVVTTGTEFQVNSTGVNIGNALTDSHVISGSLRINPNGLFVSSSGNVGIGTTSPSNLLSVGTSSANQGIVLMTNSNGATNSRWGIVDPGVNNTAYIGTMVNNDFAFYSYANERMRITSTGNVGIGTSSPSDILDVQKNQNATTNFYFRNTDTTNTSSRAYLNLVSGTNTLSFKSINGDHSYIDSTNNLYFQSSNSVKMAISSSGNVGIGTSTPLERLTIVGSNGLAGMIRWTDSATASAFIGITSGGVPYIHSNNSVLAFGANGSNNFAETMRLTSGNVEFQGTNSNAKFKFWNNYSNTQPGIAVYNTSGTEIFGFNGNTSGLSISGYVSTPTYYGTANSATFAANVSSTYSTWQMGGSRNGYGGFLDTYSGMAVMHDSGGSGGFYKEGSAKWTIYWSAVNNSVGIGGSTTVNWAAAVTNGTMFYTSESYATYDMYARSFIPTSDERLKENVAPLEDSLDKIKELQGVSYNRIEDIEKKREIGFIAQHVQEVIPEVVKYHEDTDTYGVDYDKITALLTEALKEEDSKVEAMNVRIIALEIKIQELEARLANL